MPRPQSRRSFKSRTGVPLTRWARDGRNAVPNRPAIRNRRSGPPPIRSFATRLGKCEKAGIRLPEVGSTDPATLDGRRKRLSPTAAPGAGKNRISVFLFGHTVAFERRRTLKVAVPDTSSGSWISFTRAGSMRLEEEQGCTYLKPEADQARQAARRLQKSAVKCTLLQHVWRKGGQMGV